MTSLPWKTCSRMTMEDWGIFLKCLAENYFQIDFDDAQSAQEFEELEAQLDLLGIL